MSSIPPSTVEDLAAPLRSTPTLDSLHPNNTSSSNETTTRDRELELQLDAQLRESLPPTSLELLDRFRVILHNSPDEDSKFNACYSMRRRLQWLQSMGVKSHNIFLAFRQVMDKECHTVRHLSEVLGIKDEMERGSWAPDSWIQFFGVALEAERCWVEKLRSTLQPEASGITDTRNGLDRQLDAIADAHIPAPLASTVLQSLNASSILDEVDGATSQHHIHHDQFTMSSNGLSAVQKSASGDVKVELPLRGSSNADRDIVKTEPESGRGSG